MFCSILFALSNHCIPIPMFSYPHVQLSVVRRDLIFFFFAAHPIHLLLDRSWLLLCVFSLLLGGLLWFEYRSMDTYQVWLAALAADEILHGLCFVFVVYYRILVISSVSTKAMMGAISRSRQLPVGCLDPHGFDVACCCGTVV
jgi:hypothetical protein